MTKSLYSLHHESQIVSKLRRAIQWLSEPNWLRLPIGVAGGVVVAALPWIVLRLAITVEAYLAPNCGGSCLTSALGWVLLVALIVSVPSGLMLAGAGIWGTCKACVSKFK